MGYRAGIVFLRKLEELIMSSPTDHNHGHSHAHGDDHSHGGHGESSAMESGIPLLLLVVVLAASAMFYTSSSFPAVTGAAHGAATEHAEPKH